LRYSDPDAHFALPVLIAIAVVGAIIHEWANPSIVNAPGPTDATYDRDSGAEAIVKAATGAPITLGAAATAEELLVELRVKA